MIYVNQDQLDQVHYILEQSANGNHLLFSSETIKRLAYKTMGEPESRLRLENGERLLEQMILKPNLTLKKEFLEALDTDSFEDVVRVYFNIVQNTAQETQSFKH
jgi:hypothetical protein